MEKEGGRADLSGPIQEGPCSTVKADHPQDGGKQGAPTWERGLGAGNGIRTRDFDLGKVALYH
jgi:hypothetical protein